MKSKFIFFYMAIFFSCQEQGSQAIVVEDDESKLLTARLRNIVQQIPEKTYSPNLTYVNPDYLKDSLIDFFHGNMSIEDIKKNLITKNLIIGDQADTFESEDLVIVGKTSKILWIQNILLSYYESGQAVHVDQLVKNGKGELIIPYYSDFEGESTLWTLWKQEGDSLEYTGYYRKNFVSKYASMEPQEYITRNGKHFVLGHRRFGEGGEVGNGYWLSRVIGNDILSESELFGTEYFSGDDTIKIASYEIQSDRVHFYENLYLNFHSQEEKIQFINKTYIGLLKFE